MKIIQIRNCSYCNLDGITRWTKRLILLGVTVFKWSGKHKSRPEDWQSK